MSTRDGHDSPIHINPSAPHPSSTMSTPISAYDYGTPSGASGSGARNDVVDEEDLTEDDHLLQQNRGDHMSDEDDGTDWTDGTDETVDSDGESIDTVSTGCAKAEAAQAVWGRKSRWVLFISIALSAYIYSLDGMTTYQYLYFATSTVLKHSLSGTISTAQAIIIAVGKPLMAKMADVIGRAETFIIVTTLYVIGYLLIASANDIEQIATGEIVYAFGYTGLQILQQIVIADMTTLRYRGLVTGLVSAPFVINIFVAAEILERVLPNWRWGYAMFAILVPASLAPLIIALLWAQYKARRLWALRNYRSSSRTWKRRVYDACADMDFIGLFLVAASLALILLPLGLAPTAKRGWKTPIMPAMVALGALLFPVFLWYEWKYPRKPVMPMRWLTNGPILGACLIGFFDFTSFYLQGTYLYSYIYVTEPEWDYRKMTYFAATQSLALTIFGVVGGAVMFATQRFKYMLFTGLLIRLVGVIMMIKARSATGTTLELVVCQLVQGVGGGFAAIAIQVSAQAAVAHRDVATVTAMVLLLTEVGNSFGSAIATGIWNHSMPKALLHRLPNISEELRKELFGSMEDITLYPEGSEIRLGAIAAYQDVMYRLVMGAVVVATLPPIMCLIFTKDIRLTRSQNAVEHKDLAGRRTIDGSSSPETEPGDRIHLSNSPRTSTRGRTVRDQISYESLGEGWLTRGSQGVASVMRGVRGQEGTPYRVRELERGVEIRRGVE